jgi:hypothetical protein
VQSVSVDSVAAELTQALRRLQRAIWSARVEAGLKAGKPVGATPLVHELEKQYFQLENVRVAYGLRDEECSV